MLISDPEKAVTEHDCLLDKGKAGQYSGLEMTSCGIDSSRSMRAQGRLFQHDGQSNIRRYRSYPGRIRACFKAGFFTLVYMKTSYCVALLLGLYVTVMFFYGCLYTIIGVTYPQCNLEITNLLEGFLFSLESLATIGYGTESNDVFFGNCYCAGFTLLAEICTKLLLDSLIIGTIYSRISRPALRAGTFLVSDFSIIRRVNGKLYLMFQFLDTKKLQLLSSTLRLYCVHQETTIDAISNPFKTTQIEVVYPERDYIPLMMHMPQLVVHEINSKSPLMPPQDYVTRHISRKQHRSDEEENDGLTEEQRNTNDAVAAYLLDRNIEILCLLDGTDAMTGMPTQARFSFRQRDGEIRWNRAYVSCVSADPFDGNPVIDYSAFQNTIKVPGNIIFSESRNAPYIFENLV